MTETFPYQPVALCYLRKIEMLVREGKHKVQPF